MSDLSGTERLLRQGLKRGLLPAEVQQVVSNVINLCWAADWRTLYSLLEATSGLSKGQMGRAMGVRTYDTLRFWREGKRIPQGQGFAQYAARLSELTGVEEQTLAEARSRSIAAKGGGLVPCPGWAVTHSRACLELYYYLRRLREEAGLSMEEAAEKLGVDPAQYETWETGKRTPRPWRLRRLWKVLGRPQGVLLCEMEAARDRGAQATYNERRRKAQIRLNRVALAAFEEGCSLREAEGRIKLLDEGLWCDSRYDYVRGCLRPEYVRRMRRNIALANVEAQRAAPMADEDLLELARRRHDERLHEEQDDLANHIEGLMREAAEGAGEIELNEQEPTAQSA